MQLEIRVRVVRVKMADEQITLASVLGCETLVTGSSTPVPVSSITSEYVGIYFCAHWSAPCRAFTPVLLSTYAKLKDTGKNFTVILVSRDTDERSFDEHRRALPWPAIPYRESECREKLATTFEATRLPKLVVLDASGNLVNEDARALVQQKGAVAFPFASDDAFKFESSKKLPKKILLPVHRHELELRASVYGGEYGCDVCNENGSGLVYHCDLCKYDVHPECARTMMQ